MTADSPTTIHIGFTKAASTFVQRYFDMHANIHYPPRSEVQKIYSGKIDILFDEDAAKTYLKQAHEIAGTRELVLSHERLSGNPHSGYYDIDLIANRFHRTIDNPQIVVIIREQYDLIASIYKQYVRIGGTRTLAEYVMPYNDSRMPQFSWLPLRYVEILKHYRLLFGADKVCVLPFEWLKDDNQLLLKKLCEFINVEFIFPSKSIRLPANVGIEESQIDEIRISNLFYAGKSSFRDTGSLADNPETEAKIRSLVTLSPNDFLATMDMQTQVRQLLAGSFCHSNQVLAEMLAIDLPALGYEVS